MTELIEKLKSKESMWYPACDNDLRPIHHVAFNNLYINPYVLIFNDVEDSCDFTILSTLSGIELITHNTVIRNGVNIRCLKIKVSYRGENRIKEIFFFQLSNKEMYDFLNKHSITPTTLLLHWLNDCYTPMEISWIDAIRTLGIEYCYTDNLFNLAFDGQHTLKNELINKRIRFISKQSYTGFDQRKISEHLVELSIDNCFESSIYLIQFKNLHK